MTLTTHSIKNALNIMKPINLCVIKREPYRTTPMPACRLARLRFKRFIKCGPFLMELCHTEPANKMRDQTGGMPR